MTGVDHAYSSGLLIAPFDGTAAVYDLTTDTAWFLQPLAGEVLQTSPDGYDNLALEVAATAGDTIVDQARAHIASIVDELTGAGLIGDRPDWTPLRSATGPAEQCDECVIGPTIALLDHRIAFRGLDADLVERATTLVTLPRSGDDPDTFIDVLDQPDGGVLVRMAEEWRFPRFRGLRIQLPGVLNDFIVRTGDLCILHAGVVRTPTGTLCALAGTPDAGKSTLTAALVQAGCDYAGDELLGVRTSSLATVAAPQWPSLDVTSRTVLALDIPERTGPHVAVTDLRDDAVVLGGDLPALDRIVLARYDPTVTTVEKQLLEPRAALEALTPTLLNLRRCGPDGWAALCQLCETTPVAVLRHPDAKLAAAHILDSL